MNELLTFSTRAQGLAFPASIEKIFDLLFDARPPVQRLGQLVHLDHSAVTAVHEIENFASFNVGNKDARRVYDDQIMND